MAARKGSKWIYWLLIGLILLGFGGWFTGGAGGRTTSIGTVGGLEISAQDYANALRNQMRQFQEQTGQAVTFEQAQAVGLDRAVLARLVSDRALDAEAQRLGLSVGDARVAEAVRTTPAFQGINGEFDRQAYREALRRSGLTESAFENTLRRDSTRTILQAAVLGGVPKPETYGQLLAAYSNERRDVTWATMGPESVAVLPEPTEEELQAYYDAHPEQFTAPEVRQISYAWITPDMIQGEMGVDDDEVRALYDERIDEFVQEERRLVERLVFPSDEDAQAARTRLDSGEVSFEDLVEERGLQLSDIDLGDLSREELGEVADPVFGAETGGVLGPLPSPLGPALFRVNAVLAADETTFEEAAPDLRAEIADEKARNAIGEVLPQIEDLIAGGASVSDLAEQTDLEPGQIALSEGATEGPAAYQEFREAAQAAQENDLPQVVELSDGGVLALTLDGVTPPALRPLEEVRAEVRKAWDAEALRNEILARAEERAQAIAGGASFEDQGLAPQTQAGVNRRDPVEGTPVNFSETVFAMESGEVRALPTDEGALILRLDAVEPAPEDDENVAAERDAIATQVSSSIAQDLFEAFERQLQTNTEVRLDDRAISAVNAQMN